MVSYKTPFDAHAEKANKRGYHNHRKNSHSDIISDGIVKDLRQMNPILKEHLDSGLIGYWRNRKISWGRGRNTDCVIAEPLRSNNILTSQSYQWQGAGSIKGINPDVSSLRIVIEHKSVITAHRNRDARHDDLNNLYQEASNEPMVVIGATVMIGLALKVLNIPDHIKKRYQKYIKDNKGKKKKVLDKDKFNKDVLSRIKRHDSTLWKDFEYAVSDNTKEEIQTTFNKFGTLPTRLPEDLKGIGYNALFLVPVFYDNVEDAYVARDNSYGIDVDEEYNKFLTSISTAYNKRWG